MSDKSQGSAQNAPSSQGKRYICFTPEQQAIFDHLKDKSQRYLLFRAQGFTKKDAYGAAGYKLNHNSNKGANVLESRIPQCEELLSALRGHNTRLDAFKPDSEVSKKIDELAKKDFEMPAVVPGELIGTESQVDLANMSGETAREIQFYRDIVAGKICSVKTKETFDKDGNLIGKTVEKVKDLALRMKAREQLSRSLGLNDMLQIGQIKAGSITINIVDASKDDDDDEPKNVIDAGKAEFVEEENV